MQNLLEYIHVNIPFTMLYDSYLELFLQHELNPEIGIDAKHSNEDNIAPFDDWITRYGDRIGLLGGFDLDLLCRETPDKIFSQVLHDGKRFRREAKGYALGSGNSIPDYVPADSYLAMVRAAEAIRSLEAQTA